MDYKEFREYIQKRLARCSPEQCRAFAVRNALRAMPFLWLPEDKRNTDWKNGFAYWEVEKRVPFLLAIWRAQAGAFGLAMGQELRPGIRSAAAAYASADAAYASASADAAAAAAAYAAAYAADDAAYAAADAAAAAADKSTIKHCYLQIEHDLNLIIVNKGEFLLQQAIWHPPAVLLANFLQQTPDTSPIKQEILSTFASPGGLLQKVGNFFKPKQDPAQIVPQLESQITAQALIWQKRLHSFTQAVRELDPNLQPWLNWYQARIAGKPQTQEEARAWWDYPDEIATQSPAQIYAYIQSQLSGQTKHGLKRVRAIFLGYGEAGKTSLVQALFGEKVQAGQGEMTTGVAIREWEGAQEDDEESHDLITHFWDFGGQVMAHASHQFFLRSSCLYVLVLHARPDMGNDQQVKYWLEHVRSFGHDAPVLIVGNKADLQAVDVDMARLRKEFPNILSFHSLSCTQAQDGGKYQHLFAAFQAEFCQQLRQVAKGLPRFLPQHFAVLQSVRELAASQTSLQRDDFETLCREKNLQECGALDADWLLDLLDKLGVIIHMKKVDFLSRLLIDPRWLTFGVYALSYGEKARLSAADIQACLRDARQFPEYQQHYSYDAQQAQFVIQSMCEFKLCYYLAQKKEWVLPGKLPVVVPSQAQTLSFEHAQALAYQMQFEIFLPRHLLPQMIVLCHEEGLIWKDAVWQLGVVLQDTGSAAQAWLEADYAERSLRVWIKGEGGREFLQVLRRKLLSRLEGLNLRYQEKLRLTEAARLGLESIRTEDEDWADYTQLQACLQDGDDIFKSTKGRRYRLQAVVDSYWPKAVQQTIIAQQNNHTVNINDSTILGAITVAEKIAGSFNQQQAGGQQQAWLDELRANPLFSVDPGLRRSLNMLEGAAEEGPEVFAACAKALLAKLRQLSKP